MAVRFSKLKTINLDNADEEETELLEPEAGETDGLGGEGGGVWNNVSHSKGGKGDEGKAKLIFGEDGEEAMEEVKKGRLPSWMRLGSRRSYSPVKKHRRWRKCPCNSWKAVAIAVLVFTAVFLISLIVSALIPEPSEGGVATDVPICSDLSADILRRGGSAVDAAITAMLCVGAVHPESSGIGGGGFMVVRHTNGSVFAINFREAAPRAATVDMYHSNRNLSRVGGLAVGVPGEVRGMAVAHKLFGKLPWNDLFMPVIKLCRDGFAMTNHTQATVDYEWEVLPPNLRNLFLNEDHSRKRAGELLRRKDLADTLEAIATNGCDAFYSGSIAESIVNATSQSSTGGILTLEDLKQYQATVDPPVQVDFNGYTIHSTPVPSGGPLLLFLLNVMDEYGLSPSSDVNLTYHRLIEAFKYGFALRTLTGDPNCGDCGSVRDEIVGTQINMTSESYATSVKLLIDDNHTYNISHYHAHYYTMEDSGTTHVSVLSPDGQAVSVTSTVNTYFGSKLLTNTGIVLNNEMDDFSSPNITNFFGVRPSEANFVHPGKRPLSSTCPIIITKRDSRDVPVRLIIGASGGTKIPTSVAQAALRVMSLGESLSDAVKAKRVHHQLTPNELGVEYDFPQSTLDYLTQRGHKIYRTSSVGVVQGIAVDEEGNVEAYADPRKDGKEGHAVVVQRT